MASKYTYLVEADGAYCGFTNLKDAVSEAEYRVRFHKDEKVRVTRFAHGEVMWSRGFGRRVKPVTKGGSR